MSDTSSVVPAAKRVLVIGLDGATPEYVWPWCEQGVLPNLAKLVRAGAWGPIDSTMPPFTSMAWPCVYTGCHPGKHGIVSYFDDVRAPTPKPATARSLKADPIWRILHRHGRRSIMVAAPISYPPEPIDGVMVSGMDTPSEASPFTHPPELREELLAAGYRIFIERDMLYSGETERIFQDGVRVTRGKAEAFIRLLKTEPWDFAMVVLNEIDVISHFMTDDRVRRIYEESDALVGRMLEAAGDDTVVLVVSDHGVKPLKARVFVNEILKDLGLLHLHPEPGTARTLARAGITRERVKGALHSLGVLNALRAVLPRRVWKLQAHLKPATEKRLVDVDMGRTRVYFDGGYWMRTPPGQPPLTDAELARIQEALDRLGGRIHRGADLYPGPYADRAPEYVVYVPDHYLAAGIGTGSWTAPTNVRPGDHSFHATGILSGPESLVGRGPIRGRLVDWAPTLLYLMGLPVPEHMDGEVIEGAIAPGLLRARPVQRAQAGGDGRSAAMQRIRRLKAQGRI